MLSFAVAIAIALAASAAIQTLLCVGYRRALRSGKTAREARATVESRPPRICVVMPLRGADPFLRDAIRSVVDNPYPNLVLHVVVDGAEDSAAAVAVETLRDAPSDRYRIDYLRDRSPERSLVCSSLLQAVDERRDDCDLFSFCAADMIVPRDWYWHVADAMADPSVGCTLGNRWYQPSEGRWGSLARQAWNAGAAVLMWLFRIPWGGAATLRPDDIRRSGLYEAWQSSLVEDVTIFEAMRRHEKSLKFVPAMTVVNREEIDLANAARFIERQMLWARLYHPRWVLVFSHAVSSCLSVVLPTIVSVVAMTQGAPLAAAVAIGALGLYLAALVALWIGLENAVAAALRTAGEPSAPQRNWGRTLRMFLVIPLVQLLYPWAVLRCCFASHVDWRGIRYEFLGKGKVRMVEYAPFRPVATTSDGVTSV